jgi:hypothetical protein
MNLQRPMSKRQRLTGDRLSPVLWFAILDWLPISAICRLERTTRLARAMVLHYMVESSRGKQTIMQRGHVEWWPTNWPKRFRPMRSESKKEMLSFEAHFPTQCPLCTEPFNMWNQPFKCDICKAPLCATCSGQETDCGSRYNVVCVHCFETEWNGTQCSRCEKFLCGPCRESLLEICNRCDSYVCCSTNEDSCPICGVFVCCDTVCARCRG